MRTNRSAPARLSSRAAHVPTPSRPIDAARSDAERQALAELDAWRARAMPDAAAPLDAEDLVRLLRDCVASLALDAAIVAEFTVNTVHYYRRKDIIDPPEGRTAAARYGVRHLWQIAGARLAGYLGLVTLAEARTAMRGAGSAALLAFLAARVVDARARHVTRSLNGSPATSAARALPGVKSTLASPAVLDAVMIPLPGNAWCVMPAGHVARQSPSAAESLVRALAEALGANHTA